MQVSRVTAMCRDGVDVHVQGSRRGEKNRKGFDARLLARLSQRDLLAGRLPGLGVAPRLQPAAELAVMEQQYPPAVGRKDKGACRQVPFTDPAVERIRVGVHESDDGGKVTRFLGPFGMVPEQPLPQVQDGDASVRARKGAASQEPHGGCGIDGSRIKEPLGELASEAP